MSVGGRAVQGVIWNMGTQLFVKLGAMVTSLVLTHFIAPAEYDEVQVASICVMTATMLSTIGTGQWLIARKANPDEAWHALFIHLTLGLIIYGGVIALGPSLGPWMGAPHMERFIPGFALAGFLEKVQYVPEKMLARGLSFRTIALARAAGDVVYIATSLGLAPSVGGWGMVWGNVTRAMVVASAMVIASNRAEWLRPVRLRLETVKRYFRYGAPFAVAQITEYISSRWDNLLVSRFYGKDAGGLYAMSYNLAEAPTGAIADQIGAVLMPSFAQLEEQDRLPKLVRAGSLMALVMFPLAIGLGSVAHTLFAVAFNSKWQAGAPMLVILAVLSIVKPLTWTLVGYTHAQQRRRLVIFMGVFKAATLLLAIVIIGRAGILWTCWAVGVAYAVYALVFLWLAVAPDRKAFWAYLVGCFPVLVACIPMVLAVLAVRHLASRWGLGPSWGSLIAESGAGGIVYFVSALVIARRVSRDFLNLLRNALRRRGKK